jgi:hypothetical protein
VGGGYQALPPSSTAPRFSYTIRDDDRDRNPRQKKRSAFFISQSIRDISGKNAPRYFQKNRIAIVPAARECCCRREVCRAVSAEVVTFSPSDRDFFQKNDRRFFRQNRYLIFPFRSRS